MIFFKKRHFCVLCRIYKTKEHFEYETDGIGICKKCFERLHKFSDNSFQPPGNLRGIFSAFLYENYLREAVRTFKFSGFWKYGVLFGNILGSKIKDIDSLKNCDIIIPVPLHPNRLEERGYNQSEILAEEVSKALGVPVINDALFRIKDTQKQSELKGLARVENVRDAFYAYPDCVKDKGIILVDDICTMGETLKACETALRVAGAKYVYGVTLCITMNDIEENQGF